MRLHAYLALLAFAALRLTAFAADSVGENIENVEPSEPELVARGTKGHNAYSVLSSALHSQRIHHPQTSKSKEYPSTTNPHTQITISRKMTNYHYTPHHMGGKVTKHPWTTSNGWTSSAICQDRDDCDISDWHELRRRYEKQDMGEDEEEENENDEEDVDPGEDDEEEDDDDKVEIDDDQHETILWRRFQQEESVEPEDGLDVDQESDYVDEQIDPMDFESLLDSMPYERIHPRMIPGAVWPSILQTKSQPSHETERGGGEIEDGQRRHRGSGGGHREASHEHLQSAHNHLLQAHKHLEAAKGQREPTHRNTPRQAPVPSPTPKQQTHAVDVPVVVVPRVVQTRDNGNSADAHDSKRSASPLKSGHQGHENHEHPSQSGGKPHTEGHKPQIPHLSGHHQPAPGRNPKSKASPHSPGHRETPPGRNPKSKPSPQPHQRSGIGHPSSKHSKSKPHPPQPANTPHTPGPKPVASNPLGFVSEAPTFHGKSAKNSSHSEPKSSPKQSIYHHSIKSPTLSHYTIMSGGARTVVTVTHPKPHIVTHTTVETITPSNSPLAKTSQ